MKSVSTAWQWLKLFCGKYTDNNELHLFLHYIVVTVIPGIACSAMVPDSHVHFSPGRHHILME